MTWLLILLAWTVGAVLMCPVIGRVLAQKDPVPARSSLPAPRSPLSLS